MLAARAGYAHDAGERAERKLDYSSHLLEDLSHTQTSGVYKLSNRRHWPQTSTWQHAGPLVFLCGMFATAKLT